LADTVGKPGLSDHACCVYRCDDDLELVQEIAVDFLHDGLLLGQRLMVVSERTVDAVLADMAVLGEPLQRHRRGELLVVPLSELHGRPGAVDPRAQVAAHAARLEQAKVAGYAGLRIVADLTWLVAEPAWCDVHVQCEQLVDRFMVDHPLAALCTYDQRVVGRETARSLACVHPLRQDADATFSLCAIEDGVSLEGEVDALQAPLLERALATLPASGTLVIDAERTQFIDAAAATVIVEHSARRDASGGGVRVRHAQPLLRQLWDLLGFSEIRSVVLQ
jgi:anti-anti-sigma regulatory factor